ncbi:MAG: hypothetical protein JWN26_303 [Candidatus Saccharibacteria bacterium]|nr:hypothetical protein [Candidatus Saccharibacteria bacterium]
MSMSELEFIDQRSVGDIDTPLSDLFYTQEIDLQFAEIARAEEDTKPPTEPFVTFSSQGFVSGIETQIREHYLSVNKTRFDAHLPPIDLPQQLLEGFQELVEGVKNDQYSELLVRVGHQAVRPFTILDHVATPARNYLEQGSLIELREAQPDIVNQATRSEHPRPHLYTGNYGTFLPIAWIGRILGDEGSLILKPVKPRPGTHVFSDGSSRNE